MNRLAIYVLVSCLGFCSQASGQGGIITTVAGSGPPAGGYSGDGGPATSALLNYPNSVAVDASRNLFIADVNNNRIRKVSAAGIITTVAGNGTFGFSGDGGPAISASLSNPVGVAVDASGNLFIADYGSGRIRKVSASGIITTVAGNGGCPGNNGGGQGDCFSGDGGPAISASLTQPIGVAVDASGNLFIADSFNNRIRKVTSGIITTVAGSGPPAGGYSGDGGPAISALLSYPNGVAVDASGNLFIADNGNNRIRKVSAAGIITTVAGNGTFGFSGDGGPATTASLFAPQGIAADVAGNLFIADSYNHRIRKVSASGIIATVAGNGIQGFSGDGGAATSASLNSPSGVTVDGYGNLFIADTANNRIREVSPCPVNVTLGTVGQYMEASFTPPVILGIPNPSLKDYASYCDFISFDWQQQFTVLPAGNPAVQPNNPGPLIASGNVVYLDTVASPTDGHCVSDWTNCSLIAPPFFSDPPQGGYTYQPGFNPYPFYYPLLNFFAYPDLFCTTASGGCPPFPYQVSSDGKTFSFVDDPQDHNLPGDPPSLNPTPGHFVAFKTSLVGVDSQENAHPLYSWTWNSTYKGPGGGGGVTITSINGVPLTAAMLSVSATHIGSFLQGQGTVAYSISIQNIGPAATSGVVSVTDTLPAGLTASAISGTGWACVLAAVTCSRADTLVAGGNYPPITVTLSVASNAASPVINNVSVSGGGAAPAAASDPTTILAAFADISPSDLFLPAIDLLSEYAITSGCGANPPLYCSTNNITEGQMAVFVVRSVMGGDNFTYTTTPYFSDVPASYQFFPWIQKMQDLGIALPCAPNQFCPDTPVTRGIMAVLIIRGRYSVATPSNYPAAPYFTDAGTNHPYFPWIQKMEQLGITSGCGPSSYCPDDPVTRGQMAVFIMRGEFNQLLPATTPLVLWASPASISPGQTSLVTITGQNTTFSSGVTQVNAGARITVSNISVTSPTTLTAQFAVAPGATLGPRSITVTTGSEEATLPNGLHVQQ